MNDKSKDMTGVLFRNDRKNLSSQPDRKGSCMIDGREYWVAGWLKDGKGGQFLSLAFTPKDAQAGEAAPKNVVRQRAEIIESDIPF